MEKLYIYCLIVVSGVSVVDCKWDKILRKMVVVCLIFERMLGQKIIKMIIKDSKVSNRNMNKSLNSMKKFIKKFKIVFLRILTD